MTNDAQICLRIPRDVLERISRAIDPRVAAAGISRADAFRMVLARGLAEIEREGGIAPPPAASIGAPKRKKKKATKQ